MRRRKFLELAGLLPLSWMALDTNGAESRRSDYSRFARPALLDIANDPDAVRSIGAAFRSACPEEANADVLAYKLAAETSATAQQPPRTIQQRLARSVQKDFARGRTIQLEGWILSVTEARQCALYSILY